VVISREAGVVGDVMTLEIAEHGTAPIRTYSNWHELNKR
jgi:hypothetical protein